jgi:dipeptidyl aminopeptidase/acylaminoacyl peptidase
MARLVVVRALALLFASTSFADSSPPFDAAAAFGAREQVDGLSISPDGKAVAYLAPGAGQGSVLMTLDLAPGSKAVPALAASGRPDRLGGCRWVSSERLVCTMYGVIRDAGAGLLPFTRVIAVDRGGTNLQLLSTRSNEYTQGYLLSGGQVIDWLPDQDGAVLMARNYVPDTHLGSRSGSSKLGLGVDLINTGNAQPKVVESAAPDAATYITDGRGDVRIMARAYKIGGEINSGDYHYFYRDKVSREWHALDDVNVLQRSGFAPLAVDHDLDIAYGLKKKDGRQALYSYALDGSHTEALVYANPNVDVDQLITIGRRNRVVGVTYATDVRHAIYFDTGIEKLARSLSRALPTQPQISIVDSSVDEQVMLVYAGSDNDPGVYYIFDRRTKQLNTFLVARGELEGVKLATVKSVTYPTADGQMVPGYLTLPPGAETAKNLPAIVLPHGGPSARDHWGFDWLSQYYAARGFAVLQPNFRGSAGYGDAWLKDEGFKSWRIAISDVLDAGHWLVSQGIADPAKLCVLGWSYGGYAALQSAVVDPGLFKAVVAIAPITDLEMLKEEHRNWSDLHMVNEMVGSGAHVHEGSPARNAEKIKVPVLLFHGTNDRNVGVAQSRTMDSKLASAGVKHELVTYLDLDHYLEDSSARADMLRKSDAFLRSAIGLTP